MTASLLAASHSESGCTDTRDDLVLVVAVDRGSAD